MTEPGIVVELRGRSIDVLRLAAIAASRRRSASSSSGDLPWRSFRVWVLVSSFSRGLSIPEDVWVNAFVCLD